MLSRQAEEQLADILVQRIEKANADILGEIGKSLREISTLNISKARQLQMMLKYGGDYNKIARILAKVSGKNVQDIYKIFKQVAVNNKEFAKQFYDYRNIAYIPYEQDIALKRQVLAMANITSNIYKNLSRTSQIGFFIDGQYKELEVAYKEIIDKAITTVVQGKEDFHKAMRRTLKEVGRNGLVVYESGRTRRLDSAVRMNMLDGIRMVNNETNRLFGEEYGADGVEITVHENPAPDHEDVQGRQFSNAEYEKLQTEGIALTVEGDTIDISNGKGHRPISELNCYHRPMNIIVGISKPQYSKEELQQIKERNEKGFDFEGKHYTMYEGTQLQRQLETAIRKNKDTQILARASGDDKLAKESQIKINKLTKKYNDLSKASGLTEKKERAAVSGYRKIKVEMPEEKPKRVVKIKMTDEDYDEQFFSLVKELEGNNIEIDNSIYQLNDKELRNKNIEQLNYLGNKYPSLEKLNVLTANIGRPYGDNYASVNRIRLNKQYFDNPVKLKKDELDDIKSGWHIKTDENNWDIYTITHEYGHTIERDYIKSQMAKAKGVSLNAVSWGRKVYKQYDSNLKDTLINRTIAKLDKPISRTEFKQKYWSRYAQGKVNFEWFAESFTDVELGTNKNVWTETFKEWLEEQYEQR